MKWWMMLFCNGGRVVAVSTGCDESETRAWSHWSFNSARACILWRPISLLVLFCCTRYDCCAACQMPRCCFNGKRAVKWVSNVLHLQTPIDSKQNVNMRVWHVVKILIGSFVCFNASMVSWFLFSWRLCRLDWVLCFKFIRRNPVCHRVKLLKFV